jgi:hypothetical protein
MGLKDPGFHKMDLGLFLLRVPDKLFNEMKLWLLLMVLGSTAWGAAAVNAPLNHMSAVSPAPMQIREPEDGIAEDAFLQSAREFLVKEGLDPAEIQLELRPLRNSSVGTTGHWRALAQVFVDKAPTGLFIKRLVFDREYWMGPGESGRFENRRWSKLMWHEIHHLKTFPINFSRAGELATQFPPSEPQTRKAWKRKWLLLLEPLEEFAAEKDCLEKYQAAFGPVPEPLLRDSQGDMRKHAATYRDLLDDLATSAQDHDAVRAAFPAELPVDSLGNILE